MDSFIFLCTLELILIFHWEDIDINFSAEKNLEVLIDFCRLVLRCENCICEEHTLQPFAS